MFRTLMCLVLALIVAAPVTACVPQASNETPNGADSNNASGIKPVSSASGDEVTARPKQIPGSMGGGADISVTGATGNTAGAGSGVTTPVDVTGGSGVAPDGSTVTPNGDGTVTVTVPAGKEAKIKGGIFDDKKEARDGASGTLTNGGKITAKDAKPNTSTGGYDLEDVKKIVPDPNSGVRITGGTPIPTGASLGNRAEDDEDQKDVNQKYFDTKPKVP